MTTQTLSVPGPGPAIVNLFHPDVESGISGLPRPMILCKASSDAQSLSFVVECTDDDPTSALAVWTPYDIGQSPPIVNLQGATDSNFFDLTINVRVGAIRVNLLAISSGTLTVELAA